MSLNYVMVGTNDLAKSRSYFDAVMPLIGGKLEMDYAPYAVCYQLREGRVWINRAHNGEPATVGNGNMVGLLCASEEEVQAAHAAAVANGGSDEGAPGPRPDYGPDFYGAYVRDPDGNKMSFVYFREAA
jgi:catechol 2,3-dioxygenase-like lactoylglutathione lyase family enzyme